MASTRDGGSEDCLLDATTVVDFFSPETKLLVNGGGNLGHNTHSKKLSDRIYVLEHEVAAVKACQNATVPINRLPPEILSQVFLDVRGKEARVEAASWVTVTHVCRHWRDIALRFTNLWTHLAFPHPDFTELMLSRSGSAPLHIEAEDSAFGDGRSLDILRKVLSQVARIHTISLESEENEVADVLPPSLSGAPILERLVLHGDDWDLPSTFFDGGVPPRLSELELGGCKLSGSTIWASATLTRLTLICWNEEHRPSVQDFLDALRQMPLLEFLQLQYFLPRKPTTPTSPTPIPHRLKHDSLRSLHLEDTLEAFFDFFDLVEVQNVRKMTLETVNRESRGSLGRLIQLLRSSWNGGRRPSVHEIRPLTRQGVSVSLLDSYVAKELTLTTPYASSDSVPLHRLLMNTGQFDFEVLQVLTLDYRASAAPAELVSVFGQYQKLQVVELEENFSVSYLLYFLKSTSRPAPTSNMDGDHPNPETAPLNFPSLEVIICSTLNFGYDGDRVKNIAALVKTLKGRSKRSKLKKLSFGTCSNFTAREFQLLSDPPIPGLEIVWDGTGTMW
ncbi:hypothetical protein NMY22_g2286 [Coprinellus aureogranulatus]|nr:hypothetical protein NMY22_g2286 [Coprinellus aureogranulatus]